MIQKKTEKDMVINGYEPKDTERIEKIMYKLGRLWVLHPQQRFFQLLYNYTELGTRDRIGTVRDPFRYEDDVLEAYLDAYLKESKKLKKKK